MTIIKKAYEPMVDFLELNKGKKVQTILEELKAMCAQKSNLKSFVTNDKKEVVAVFCYYHKQWELVDKVAYGKKASSTTGLNTMCKVGTSKWTQQNKRVKAVNATVLDMLEKEELELTDIADTKTKLIEEAKAIDTIDMPEGFETAEEALEASKA